MKILLLALNCYQQQHNGSLQNQKNFSANRKCIVFQQISKAYLWYEKEFEGVFLPSFKRTS